MVCAVSALVKSHLVKHWPAVHTPRTWVFLISFLLCKWCFADQKIIIPTEEKSSLFYTQPPSPFLNPWGYHERDRQRTNKQEEDNLLSTTWYVKLISDSLFYSFTARAQLAEIWGLHWQDLLLLRRIWGGYRGHPGRSRWTQRPHRPAAESWGK